MTPEESGHAAREPRGPRNLQDALEPLDPFDPLDPLDPRDPLDRVLARQSVGIKHLAEPGPGDAELQRMAQAALRAPDHAGLVPYRFAVVRGAARVRLGELFVQAARAAGKDEAGAALDDERAHRATVTVAVIARQVPGNPNVRVH